MAGLSCACSLMCRSTQLLFQARPLCFRGTRPGCQWLMASVLGVVSMGWSPVVGAASVRTYPRHVVQVTSTRAPPGRHTSERGQLERGRSAVSPSMHSMTRQELDIQALGVQQTLQ